MYVPARRTSIVFSFEKKAPVESTGAFFYVWRG